MAYHEHLRRNAPDYRLVNDEVRRVLDENYISEPPVKPTRIAEAYGIEVLTAKFETHPEVSGFFSWSKKKIFVNAAESAKRQTFTIAHELGHYFLHRELFERYPKEYEVLFRAPIGAANTALEKEANAFAANLLVPTKMLKSYGPIATMSELSTLFNVSEDVIGYRRANLEKFAA